MQLVVMASAGTIVNEFLKERYSWLLFISAVTFVASVGYGINVYRKFFKRRKN